MFDWGQTILISALSALSAGRLKKSNKIYKTNLRVFRIITHTDLTDHTDMKRTKRVSVSSYGSITESVPSFSVPTLRWCVQQPPAAGRLQHQGVSEYLEATTLRWFCQWTYK